MELSEFFNYRDYLLDEAKDEHGFISESSFLSCCLPALHETKLIDSEDFNECYCSIDNDQLKLDGYLINESGERLQLFVINEESIQLESSQGSLKISQKAYYERHFARCVNFVKKAIKKHLDELIQDSSPVKPLLSFLGSPQAINQIDVVEVFLISSTVTVETRGESPQPKTMEFDDDSIKVSYTLDRVRREKELIVLKRLVDLNFLYSVVISQGNRESLKIDFLNPAFNYRISCIQAANETNFESYLCVLPAPLLAELYKRYSSRMLEKNVRSFLQLRGVNKGMQETIVTSPEKFIAYNNGLTITATGKELMYENGLTYLVSLTDFQIVNGGQTTATIYFSKKAGLDISRISVMAKVNVAKDATEEELDELISNISTYSNAQSRVSKVDLRSRSIQLVKLKSLSESVLTPSGKKWFFERAKGEFNTLIRKSPHQKNRINRDFPKERRFTKEELAKYYSAWGTAPYLVKKGGEKVFRHFIEEITGEARPKKVIDIDRSFYEELISRIILFRSLEKLYGSGANSIGQIRSAVVPYSISVLFKYTNGAKKELSFDLQKIWKAECLDDLLQDFFLQLMRLMNSLIKKYSASDDLGEYSKKEELWSQISGCGEINEFMGSATAVKVIDKYCAKYESNKRAAARKQATINFEPLGDMVLMYNNQNLYKTIQKKLFTGLKNGELLKLEKIISSLQNNEDLAESLITFEKNLIRQVRVTNPEIFDEATQPVNTLLSSTFDFILRLYNKAIEEGLGIHSEFLKINEIANKKHVRFGSVYDQIGRLLEKGELPTIKQLVLASEYLGR